MSRFVGCLVVLVSALFVFGCANVANTLPPGPAVSIPANSVVVFGKIEIKSDLTCDYFMPKKTKVCEKYKEELPSLRSYRGEQATFQLHKDKNSTFYDFGNVAIPAIFGEEFYAVVPKSPENFFGKMESTYLVFRLFRWRRTSWIECPTGPLEYSPSAGGFAVPHDTSAAYIGTIIINSEKTVRTVRNPVGIRLTLLIKDEYDQAAQRLRARNPDFRSRIVKSLLRHRDHMRPPDAVPPKLECRWKK